MQQNVTTFFQLTPIPHIVVDSQGRVLQINPACERTFGLSITMIQNKELYNLVHESYRQQFLAWLTSDETTLTPLIVLLKPSHQSEFYVQLQGQRTPIRSIISLTPLSDELVSQSKSIQDETGNQLESLFDTTELQQLRITGVLYESILAITSTLDLEEVLDKILENVAQAVPHDAADIMLTQDGVAFVVRSRGYNRYGLQDVIQSLRFPIQSTPTLTQMVRTRSPLIISDLYNNNAWIERPRQDWMRAYVGVPIRMSDEVIGFLNLVSSKANQFDEDYLQWLNIFATQAAVAINNARIHEKSREFAIAEERQRMAREIHDTVSQMLFSSSMIAESLTVNDKITDENLNAHLRHIFRLNRGALAEMRLLLLEYKPENLVKAELPLLLERLKLAIEGRKEIKIELDIDDGHPAPPNVRLELYRIAQEALNNITKHTNAEYAYIQLSSTIKDVILVINDRGQGFDVNKAINGEGIRNMRVRAESIGATLRIESIVEEGTTVKVHWLRNSDV